MTLKEISNSTGYSISTVSKALNNKEDIGVRARAVIQEFALLNKYVPNKNAIALRKNKTFIIAVILPRVNNIFYSESLCNIQKAASKLGYRIMLFQSFENQLKEKEYLDQINDGSIDGAIVLSTNLNNKNELVNTKLPVEYTHISAEENPKTLQASCALHFDNLIKKIA